MEERLKMSIRGIDAWLGSPQGRYVMAWEEARIGASVADLFGYNALQIGLPQYDLLAMNRMPLHRVAGQFGEVDVRCKPSQLPFGQNSVDLVVMPHALEFHEDPHQILREVERILIPDGKLVITGFNPFSLWGFYRFVNRRSEQFPVSGNFLSISRLKDWLQLLGFEVERGCFGCYAPPLTRENWLRRLKFLESAGDRWWGFAGSVYLLRAVKRVHGMRLILPAWGSPKNRRKTLGTVAQRELK